MTHLNLLLKLRVEYTSTLPYVFMAWCLVKHRIHLHGVTLNKEQGQLYL